MPKDLLSILKKRPLIMDGAMGTILMSKGIAPGENFDLQNLKQPQLVYDVHKAYVDAGADIIETNTFGANRIKLNPKSEIQNPNVENVNKTAVRLAKKAAGEKAFVLGSVGPIGKLLEPMGILSFDEAHDVFKEQITALISAGVDGLILETISDLQEMRAALIAAREVTDKPIVASMTYDETGKTITGTSPEVAALVLESLGASIISANCSMGPASLLKIAQRLISASNLPVMVMPNAGTPDLINGQAVYKMTPDQFAGYAVKFVKLGVRIFGGCCGTTPEHILSISRKLRAGNFQFPISNFQLNPKSKFSKDVFASRTKVFPIGGFLKIGERINPTGRKVLAQQIKDGQTILIRQDAVNQTKAGASILDVNVSVPDVDGKAAIKKAIHTVEVASNLSLSIDSPDPDVIEAGLKAFPGRVLINSVNGKDESLQKVLSLIKKYGASVIALCLDKKGIPATAPGKLKIAQKIVKAAEKLGISKDRIWVDCLVMTAGIGVEKPLETLEAMSLIKKKLKVKTSLGISNCSHGLPGRSQINALYLELAILKGLDGAIIDVTDQNMRKMLKKNTEHRTLSAEQRKKLYKQSLDKFKYECTKWNEAKARGFKAKARSEEDLKLLDKATHIKGGVPAIKQAIMDGDAESVVILVKAVLADHDPQKIIDEALVPPMEQVGKWFSEGKYFLPQVMASAEAMSKGFELCKAKIPLDKIKNKGTILLATVKGDIHDIGKNIVRMMLENNGFKVLDLGKDVEAEEILKTALKEKPKAIALSALLTTTMVQMEAVKAKLLEAGLDIPIIIGGAVVTPEYAERIGVYYGADAAQAVDQAKQILKNL